VHHRIMVLCMGMAFRISMATLGKWCAATTNNALLVTRTGFGGYPVGQLPNLMPKG